MAREQRSPEEIVAKLRQVEALRLGGKTCAEAVRSIGVSEVTYRRWRGEFGGLMRTLRPAERFEGTVQAARKSLLFGLCILAVTVSAFAFDVRAQAQERTCKYVSQLPDDCAGAQLQKLDHLRSQRYREINLFAKDVIKKILYVSSYDTTGLNGGDDSGDSAPDSLARNIDTKATAKQYQALLVQVSPPRCWTIDWLADRVGKVRTFSGLNAAWMGNRAVSAAALLNKPTDQAYRISTVAQTAAEGFKKGSKVYLLDDPKGRTWVMASYTDNVAPESTIDKLETLGGTLAMPPGWKYRVAVLAKELVLLGKSGTSAYTQDDKGNVYALTGPDRSNFSP